MTNGNDRIRRALEELVRLKDGLRDEEYERRKPQAWQEAREALKEMNFCEKKG